MEEVILRLSGIQKSFGGTEIIKGLSLDVVRGEFVTLLGPSGCGKTTTLRIIAGLEMPDSGFVYLNGNDITGKEANDRNVNTVFQNYALFPHMNVFDNIGYGPRIRKVNKNVIREKVNNMLSLVQMEGFGKRMPHQLSGGQRQRIAIARALINEPDIILLDEPLGALDLKLRQHMQAELKQLQKKTGVTFIYVTHDQEEALNMSDKVAVMNNGKIEQYGSPHEIYDMPVTMFVAEFVGERNIWVEGEGVEKRHVALHTDKTFLTKEPGTTSFFKGVVMDKSFTGSQTKISVLTDTGKLFRIVEYNGVNNSGAEIGDCVYIGWDDANLITIPAEGLR